MRALAYAWYESPQLSDRADILVDTLRDLYDRVVARLPEPPVRQGRRASEAGPRLVAPPG